MRFNKQSSVAAKKTHLIIYTDSILSSDVNTFRSAAQTLHKDYTKHYSSKGHEIKLLFVKTGMEIVSAINGSAVGSIVSLDIVSHGNQGGIHIVKKLKNPIPATPDERLDHWAARNPFTEKPQSWKDSEYKEESMHGLYSNGAQEFVARYFNQERRLKEDERGNLVENKDCATLSDIEFDRFASDAFVEFHGCRTAESNFINKVIDNFAEDFSEHLPSESVTVGHIVNNYPNGHPSGNKNDYRHNKVRCYQDGELYPEGADAVERWSLKFKNSSTPP